MPKVVLFRDADGRTPILEWMDGLPRKARELCMVRVERLRDLGHELRRPEAAYLRAGIYELRAKSNGVQYRVLYFFDGKATVVVSHGISQASGRGASTGCHPRGPVPASLFDESNSPHPRGDLAMKKNRAPTTDGVEILHRRYFEGHPERIAALEIARREANTARKIHQLRTRAGLTQLQLARRVGTTASVISRLEDADYEGYSLKTLYRIATALDCVVELRFVPRKRGRRASAS